MFRSGRWLPIASLLPLAACSIQATEDSSEATERAVEHGLVICHIVSDNPDENQTITIPAEELEEHLAHGDTVGPCPGDSGGSGGSGGGEGGFGGSGGEVMQGGSGGGQGGWPEVGGSSGGGGEAGGSSGSSGSGGGESITCESWHGSSCNTDMGYGDHCAPSDNTGGCSDERFWAWCNRRNPDMPGIWDDWIQGWVDEWCDGTVSTDTNEDGYEYYYCYDSSDNYWECTTPLVLAFDAIPVVFGSPEHGFSLAADGRPAKTDWPTAATPWLALDRNGNGRIDDGSELFGSATRLQLGELADHGFEALSVLDQNGDRLVDPVDADWSRLLVWVWLLSNGALPT